MNACLPRSRGFASILLVAAGIRFLALLWLGPVWEADSFTYDNLAQNLAAGKGFIDTRTAGNVDAGLHRTPLYPLFLAGFYALFRRPFLLVIGAQQLLGLASLAALYALARRLFGERTARCSGWILALHPWLVVEGNTLMTETLFVFLFSLSLLLLTISLQEKRIRTVAWSAFFFGLAILCRPAFQYFFLLLPLLGICMRRPCRFIWRNFFIFTTVALLIVSPWLLRNHRVYGVVSLSSLTGSSLLGALDLPAAAFNSTDPFEREIAVAAAAKGEVFLWPGGKLAGNHKAAVHYVYGAFRRLRQAGYAPAEIERRMCGIALRQILHDPLRYLVKSTGNMARFWSGYPLDWLGGRFSAGFAHTVGKRDLSILAAKVFARVVLGAMLALGFLFGAVALWRNRPIMAAWLPFAAVGYAMLAASFLVDGNVRYRFPAEAFIIIIAVNGLLQLLAARRSGTTAIAN